MPCGAWGPQGHRTIGAIADRMLTPAARSAVRALLADDRDKFGRVSGRTTLEAVSVWADEVRGTDAARPAWHYDDQPVCASQPKSSYCREGQCNTEQLKRLIGVLADRRQTVPARNEALKWVVHLMGDLHQPLHAANHADRGGNAVKVALEGVRTRGRQNLHRLWDTEFVTRALNTRIRQRPPADIDALTTEAASLLVDGGQGSPDSWASESNHLARNVAYNFQGFACDRAPQGILVLNVAYQEDAAAIVRERLLLAGARLAGLLNQTLASNTSEEKR